MVLLDAVPQFSIEKRAKAKFRIDRPGTAGLRIFGRSGKSKIIEGDIPTVEGVHIEHRWIGI
jgi:hypothetical protein